MSQSMSVAKINYKPNHLQELEQKTGGQTEVKHFSTLLVNVYIPAKLRQLQIKNHNKSKSIYRYHLTLVEVVLNEYNGLFEILTKRNAYFIRE